MSAWLVGPPVPSQAHRKCQLGACRMNGRQSAGVSGGEDHGALGLGEVQVQGFP